MFIFVARQGAVLGEDLAALVADITTLDWLALLRRHWHAVLQEKQSMMRNCTPLSILQAAKAVEVY